MNPTRAMFLVLSAALATNGCRCSGSSVDTEDAGRRPEQAPDAGGGPGGSVGRPSPPFLRVVDTGLGSLLGGGVIDSHRDVWLWPDSEHIVAPVHVSELEDVYSLSIAGERMCALLGGGEVRCVANPDYWRTRGGMVRVAVDGGLTALVPRDAPLPQPVSLGFGYRSVDGWCGIKRSGDVWCLTGNSATDGTPMIERTNENVVQISRGCVLYKDGHVSCAREGATEREKRQGSRRVADLSAVVEIAAGWDSACARKQDGTVWCWGDNTYGQLGVVRGVYREKPEQVKGIGEAISIAAGDEHVCVLERSGLVFCWGSNDRLAAQPQALWRTSSCADETCLPPEGGCVEVHTDSKSISGPSPSYTRCPTPQIMPGLVNVTYLAPGATCAIVRGGRVLCWGRSQSAKYHSQYGSDTPFPDEISWDLRGDAPVDAGK
jgi:hypothetical protein